MNMLVSPPTHRNRYQRDVERVLAMTPDDADIDPSTLGAAFLASPYASILLDHEHNVLVCNRRAERMYVPCGITGQSDVRGLGLHKLTHMSREELAHALRSGAASSTVKLRMRVTNSISSARPTVFRVALLRSRHKGDRLYLLTQDHLKAAAEALAQLNQRRVDSLEELTRIEARFEDLQTSLIAMEAFSFQASHDLRTPLATLSGILQLIDGSFGADFPEKMKKYLSVMENAVCQMDTLTSDFLKHARSVTGAVKAEPVQLGNLLRDVRRDVLNGFSSEDARIDIRGVECTLMAEPTLLRMMVLNLLNNALKYKKPAIPLVVQMSLSSPPEGGTVLTISDNGIGFDPRQSEAIFQPFHRANTKTEGSGMGLSTCVEICRRHGWSINGTSDGENGAKFCITFPQTQARSNL